MKRVLSLILALVLAVALAVPAFAVGAFTDVSENAWYAEAVDFVQSEGLMAGTRNGKFSPNVTTSRAMLVTVLYRNAGSPPGSPNAGFTDVKPNAYYANAVNWAAANDIVSGYGDGRFGVDDPVTRQDAATILWRYEGEPTVESSQDFADEVMIYGYAATAVDWARENGIINGRGNNRFDPRGNATRAEIAMILMNYLTREDEPTPPAPITPPAPPVPSTPTSGKILVVYFSATGSTERVGGYIADALDADTFELVPTNPYTSADLNWTDQNSRVVREHNDPSARNVALTASTVANWDEYDIVFIGYPIWWGIAAWPVDTFIKANDFTGKTVIPFCTSSSSGMGESGRLLADMAGTGDWQTGQRFSSGASESTVRDWALSLAN